MRRYTFYSQNYKDPKVFLTDENLQTLWHRIDADECRLASGDMVKVECVCTDGEWWTYGCYVLASEWMPIHDRELDEMLKWDRHVLASIVRRVRASGFEEGVEAEKRNPILEEEMA